MAQKTKQQLKDTFVDGYLMKGSDFADLLDSLKGVQSPVSSPAVSGNATAFIDSISQDDEGNIVVTKKNVNFSGYQTTAGMAVYQDMDLQRVGDVTVAAGVRQTINHNKKHYPTVRLIDETGMEVSPSEYQVKHIDKTRLEITLGGSLSGRYKYILD